MQAERLAWVANPPQAAYRLIKRNILFSILKDDYGIISRFEPGIYPGVNNKFYWNKLFIIYQLDLSLKKNNKVIS